ncbi:MAG: imidazoleglycerol-phosphate dehydratase HisB [Oligosphaeraceae bacterium]
MSRCAKLQRNTRETRIQLELDLDQPPLTNEVATGVPFFDHMLDAAFRHGRLHLRLQVQGDLEIDAHHTLEDTGLALGQALKTALGEKKGIQRFGEAAVPLDEALARVVVDLSGRPHLSWRCPFPEAAAGGISVRLYHEFFQAFANAAAITLHVDLLAGEENHHCLEAIFKALGRALRMAVAKDPDMTDQETPSTKGVLE